MVRNITSILIYPLYGRTAEIPAVASHHTLANTLVITIKHKSKVGVKQAVIWLVWFQDKLLKEPGGVPQVPLWGRHVHNGLNDIILGLQRFADGL